MPDSHAEAVQWMLGAALLALASPSGLAGQEYPAGFAAERIGGPWSDPVGLAFIAPTPGEPGGPRRLLVAEREGRVWLVEDDVKKNLVYDIATETLVNGDRGLLGIAVAPDFMQEGWLYLLLVVDTRGSDRAPKGFSRLIRIRTEFDGEGNLVTLPETRTALIGSDWSTGIPSCHLSHTIGSLRFLSDGSLVLATGDNAHYDFTDAGGQDEECFLPGRTSGDQDVGAFRAQYDHTLCGKVLRVDPATGLGLPDNPEFTGDPEALLSRVYARGLRNPFRFTLLPGTGPREALLIGDVGWNTWEEIDLCLGGENFGWPCYEGLNARPEYQGADVHGFCAGLAARHTPPLLAWHHSQGAAAGFRGNCASGLAVYSGVRYPEIYRGRLFFLDYGSNWLRAAELDGNLAISNVLSFGRELAGPVDMVTEPSTGDIVFASIFNQGVFRLRYVGSGQPPTAVASATPAFGPGNLEVVLSAAGSSDPEGQELTYAWDFGDGGPPVSGLSDPELPPHFYGGEEGSYTARLTVTDSEGLTDSAEVRITPHDTPPEIVDWLAPLADSTFEVGEELRLGAVVSDVEDGADLQTLWTLDLVRDHEVHPGWGSVSGALGFFEVADPGPGDRHFVVRLRVTDSRGLAVQREVEVFDADSPPQAHLDQLDQVSVRVGQELAPVGHADFSYGRIAAKKARLTWDWGDGTSDVFHEVDHQEETRPRHAYLSPGTYKLRLSAENDGEGTVDEATIQVGPARAALAIFAPLDREQWIPREQQEEIVSALGAALAGRTSEVRAFHLGQGASLAAWMESLLSDGIADVVVLLDYLPAALVEGGLEGSLLQRWMTLGNGVVWTGYTPFLQLLADNGRVAQSVLAADELFDAAEPYVVLGAGTQEPTSLGVRVLPSLPAFHAQRSLRYDQVGPAWRLARLFASDADADQDSDALELEHASRGFYAQFLCDDAEDLPRAAVLSEYLLDRLGRDRAGPAPRLPARR